MIFDAPGYVGDLARAVRAIVAMAGVLVFIVGMLLVVIL